MEKKDFTWESTTNDLQVNNINAAMISIGATEQCGPCLPFHIDTLLAELYARHFGQAISAYILPTLPFNTSEEHTKFRGTVSVTPVNLMNFLENIVVCLRKQGFVKQAITGGHGGAYWFSSFIKYINHKYEDMVLVSAHCGADKSWNQGLKEAGLKEYADTHSEIHGGLISKCIALYLCPDLVREGRFGQNIDRDLGSFIDYGVWHKIAKDGCWGDSGDMNEGNEILREKGKILLETFLELQVEFFKEHFKKACELKGIS